MSSGNFDVGDLEKKGGGRSKKVIAKLPNGSKVAIKNAKFERMPNGVLRAYGKDSNGINRSTFVSSKKKGAGMRENAVHGDFKPPAKPAPKRRGPMRDNAPSGDRM